MNPLASKVRAPTQFPHRPSQLPVAPTLTVSQFKVTRPTAAAKRKPTATAEAPLTTDPRAYHAQRLAEFARDYNETLPLKRQELNDGNLDPKQRKLLGALVSAMESRVDEKRYKERVTPLLKRYEDCLRESQLTSVRDATQMVARELGQQHFGRVENKELKAAKEAFFMETMGYVPVSDVSSPAGITLGTAAGASGPASGPQSCDDCKTPLVVADGYDVCIDCGAVPVNSCSDYQVSYRDTQDMMVKTNGSYTRSARFSDWLSSIQAKENTEIPTNVYDAIRKEIERERISDLENVTVVKIREYLGKMRLTRYYDHAPRIVKYITGKPPVDIPPDIEVMFNIMFNHIQIAYEYVRSKFAPERSSFMHYNYVLFKFCELLGCTDIVKPPLLKCHEKLRFQEMLWKEVCDMVGWPFIATI